MIGIAMLLITQISKLEKCQVGSQLKRKLYQNEQTFSINKESFSNEQLMKFMPSCVPITPITATVPSGNVVHERQQLPLTLSWAATIHKNNNPPIQDVSDVAASSKTPPSSQWHQIKQYKDYTIPYPIIRPRTISPWNNTLVQTLTKQEQNITIILFLFHFPGTPPICYLHNLFPLKRSQENNHYFDGILQLRDKSMRAVRFSPDKHTSVKVKLEPSSPIKISDYHVKCNRYSDKDKVHINKRTKLSEPNKSEITFDFTKIPEREQEDTEYTDSIQEIIASKITKTNGKTLRRQECTLTNKTGSEISTLARRH
ncbi:unnamed protein product [Pocillopora meandrina]|uniref:Uncharacterized protein n=1 Tax=Pocillopora meandrina TaxID=46732 RepID=A0AAU9VNA1_9CNID|nr:unnamed protein product [Pocillopora meandrina]